MPKKIYQEDLAYVHHAGYGQIAENAAQTLLKKLTEMRAGHGLIVDLGCGSGILAKTVSETGYEVIGLDYSFDILEIAKKQAPKATFAQASFFDYEFPKNCTAITATGEIFTYLFDDRNTDENLRKLFEKIHKALKNNGLLLFDLLAPNILNGATESVRRVEEENWSMFVTYREDLATQIFERDIALFRKLENGLFRKSREVHQVRLNEPAKIRGWLEEIGFEVEFLGDYAGAALRDKHYAVMAIKN